MNRNQTTESKTIFFSSRTNEVTIFWNLLVLKKKHQQLRPLQSHLLFPQEISKCEVNLNTILTGNILLKMIMKIRFFLYLCLFFSIHLCLYDVSPLTNKQYAKKIFIINIPNILFVLFVLYKYKVLWFWGISATPGSSQMSITRGVVGEIQDASL